MNNRDRTVVGKVLDEIAIAESLMQNEDLASFLEDEKLKRAVCMTVINIGIEQWQMLISLKLLLLH